VEIDAPGLVQYWLEFDVAGERPSPMPGTITLDGGSLAYRVLGRGIGVTGYDEGDCLTLVRGLIPDLPAVTRSVQQPKVDDAMAREVGNPAWRGVWFPRLNLAGPVLS
jgi:hypothetical protein